MLELYGRQLESRLMLGTAQYPSPDLLSQAVRRSGAQIVTVSLRRESAGTKSGHAFWTLIQDLNVNVLPNTAGCQTARDAVNTAKMAREVFSTNWIKLEVIGDEASLQPDPFGLVEAAKTLAADGFEVFPYMTEDLVLADRLLQAGCRVLMPWGAPIGTGRGLNNVLGLSMLRTHFPEVPLVVDAGIGAPSHAAKAMELGYDAVLINTAVAKAANPAAMADAFGKAVEAGRLGFEAGLMPKQDTAQPSTPVFGAPFSPFG
ncbi:MAG: thiazole synthase [Stappiaceae bacterium]